MTQTGMILLISIIVTSLGVVAIVIVYQMKIAQAKEVKTIFIKEKSTAEAYGDLLTIMGESGFYDSFKEDD